MKRLQRQDFVAEGKQLGPWTSAPCAGITLQRPEQAHCISADNSRNLNQSQDSWQNQRTVQGSEATLSFYHKVLFVLFLSHSPRGRLAEMGGGEREQHLLKRDQIKGARGLSR